MKRTAIISTGSRLGLALLVATTFHVLVFMYVGFTVQNQPALSTPLKVTLTSFKTEQKPAQADYPAQKIAQQTARQNPQGRSTQTKKTLPTTNNPTPFQGTVIHQEQNVIQPPDQREPPGKNLPKVVTTSRSDHKKDSNHKEEQSSAEMPKKPVATSTEHDSQPIDLREEIAALETLFNKERQAYARPPRVKRLTALSTLQEPGAFYKESWRRKVEKVGNINYPEQARTRHIYGELSLLVAINRDGSLDHVEVLKSSGYPVLDDAAVRIVRLAAPYAPFGDDLKDYDQVEIIRTWRFEPTDKLFSAS